MPRFPVRRKLDLPTYVGQRSATFAFSIVDAVTGYRRVVKPAREPVPTLNHNTASTIKRTLGSVYLNREDTAAFSSISSRLEVSMLIDDESFPLGRYVPSDWARFESTAGKTSSASFYDEGFIVDQQITSAFGALTTSGEFVTAMIARFLRNFPVEYSTENSNFTSLGSWSAGTRGGYLLEQLALDGDYLSPWFDHQSIMRFIRNFNPADQLPTFDLDLGKRVLQSDVVETDNLIDAPNRFVVIGNGVASLEGPPVVGIADVPNSAPHSILNRGFIIPDVSSRQLRSIEQAQAVAENLVQRQTLFEQVELLTPPDPRHDSYDVIRWQNENWLEISWSLPLREGSPMRHTLRKIYS